MGRFIIWALFQLFVIMLTWKSVGIGLYLISRASDAAVVVGCTLLLLSILLGGWSTYGLWNLWRRKQPSG